jgi:Flp pilus assembly protein TadD/4-amino-4-deoxy-L-arabinose transferase-like glycosyltransferase
MDQTPANSGRTSAFVRRLRNAAPLMVVLLVCFVVRLAFLIEVRGDILFRHPVIDAKEYDLWAQKIAGGDVAWKEVQIHGPVYPFFLAAVFAVFGHSYLAAGVVQCVLGTLNCLFVFLIGRRLFGTPTGLVACAAAGLSWMLFFYDVQILPVTLEVLLDLLAVWLLVVSDPSDLSDRSDGRGRQLLVWLAGMVLGLSALVRPTVLLFAAMLCAWLLFRGLREKKILSAARLACLLALGLVLPIAPVAARNRVVSGEFVMIQKNSGLNFYLGNGRDMNGYPAVKPGVDYDTLMREPAAKGFAGPSAHDRYFYRKGWEFISSSPGKWAELELRKSALFFGAAEICPSADIPRFRERSALPWRIFVPFGVMAPFALAWLGLSVWRRRAGDEDMSLSSARLVPVILLISVFVSCALFTTCSRYRMAAVPVLIIFASAGAMLAMKRMIRGDRAGIAQILLVLAAFALLVNVDWTNSSGVRLIRTEYHLGLAFAEEGRPAEALEHFENQLRETPDDPDCRRDLGLALNRLGRHAEAEKQLVIAAALRPDYADAWEALGRAQLLQGRPAEALETFRKAARMGPKCWRAFEGAGLALMELGKADPRMYEHAIREYLSGLCVNPDSSSMNLNLGTVYARIKEYGLAEVRFRKCIELDPSSADGHLNLGVCLYLKGSREEALEHARTAQRLGSPKAEELLHMLGE